MSNKNNEEAEKLE